MVAKVVEFYEFLVPELQPGWCVGRTKVLCSELGKLLPGAEFFLSPMYRVAAITHGKKNK